MTRPSTVTGGNEALVLAYEALRTHVLQKTTDRSATGLVVLLRQGMAAWMARCWVCSASPAPSASPVPKTTPMFADEAQAALVQVFASMVLADRKEVCV